MGLDKVITRVEQEGDDTIKTILAEAEKQAEETLTKARQTTTQLQAKKHKETDKQIKALRVQEENSLEIETKKIRLNAEKEVLQAAYHYCLKSLKEQPTDKLLTSLLAKATKELPDAAYVNSNPHDAPIVRGLTTLTYSGTIDCLGGIIVENKDHTLKLDLRYETIAASLWDAHLKEIADLLLK
jgi:V/A-type H+/Na+-transporting ATPase subunit E